MGDVQLNLGFIVSERVVVVGGWRGKGDIS